MSEITTALCDLDGTLLDREGSLYPGLDRVLAYYGEHFSMTAVTARGITKFLDAVRDNPALQPMQHMPIALEYGARIVETTDITDLGAYRNIWRRTFTNGQYDAIVDAAQGSKELRYLGFYPNAADSRRTVWLPEGRSPSVLPSHQVTRSIVTSGSLPDLHRLLRQEKPGLVVWRSDTDTMPPQLQEAELQNVCYRYGGGCTTDLLPTGLDKREAALQIIDMCSLDPTEVLIAGDSPIDAGMLAIQAIRPVAVQSHRYDASRMPAQAPVIHPRSLDEYLRRVLLIPDKNHWVAAK